MSYSIYPPVYKNETSSKFSEIIIKEMSRPSYNDWQKDDEVTHCECGKQYKFWGPSRHHCNLCGTIFCSTCCKNFYPHNIVRSDIDVNHLNNYVRRTWGEYAFEDEIIWYRVCKHCEKDVYKELRTFYSKKDSVQIMRSVVRN